MADVRAFPGAVAPDQPDAALVELLRDLVKKAESGELRSFIGTGFLANGRRMSLWGEDDSNPDLYSMYGALCALPVEYMKRHDGP